MHKNCQELAGCSLFESNINQTSRDPALQFRRIVTLSQARLYILVLLRLQDIISKNYLMKCEDGACLRISMISTIFFVYVSA